MNYFNWILNYELSAEQELDGADNVIYQPHPLHMSGLMKLDINKVTRITSNSAVAMWQPNAWMQSSYQMDHSTHVNTGKNANNDPDM
jgi:hypothetical protein